MRRVTTVVLTVVCVTLLGVVTNVATGVLPDRWSPYLWVAWPLLAFVATALTVVEVRRAREPGPVGGASAARARRVLLDRVRRYWITSVLDRSLHMEARLQLGITASADDRRYPWTLRASHRDGFTGVLDDRTSVAAIFERLDRAMVILGAPGAGKTTTLLELARELLDGAETDRDAPVPVVLNLSSWATRRQPLAQWLTEQLTERYGIPSAQAAAWVAGGEILPLLDGLDEVVEARRDECVAAIAAFHAQQPLTPIALCCRAAEYQRLRTSLPVYGTVTIEPLTRPQIERHLDRSGPALAGLRAALAADEELWEFTGSPLLLSIMALAYADGPGPETGTGSRRHRLFARYTETMLRHRPHPGYLPEQATRYLSLLGDRMRARQQSIFVLDLVAPDWSPTWPRRDADLYSRTAISIAVGLVVALCGAALAGRPGLAAGPVAAVLTALGLAFGEYDDLTLIARWGRRPEGRRSIRVNWLTDTATEFAEVLFKSAVGGSVVAGTLAVGAVFGLSGGWAGLLTGLAYWGGFALAALLAMSVGNTVAFHLYVVGPPGGAPRREVPSPALRQRLRFALRATPALGVIAGTPAGLLVAWPRTDADGFRYGLLVGTAATLYLLASVAVGPILEQWLVRRRLAREDALPRPLRPFLDYAVQCLFLRDVGDGYIFVHRELLEFFADQVPAGQLRPLPPPPVDSITLKDG
ncbi:NACHT domain-containing protein [Micromonospora rubida]|uniref:NACHT domain-containing protein n=1 Tax=Micromonospora rubida TaxID=2697657 RepID=UPI001376990B|nr:NACHT domain-containing protein [Micromonospora rubida]NBE85243.1 NACHT domain-containing protein [Micromonospora rubida]